MVLCGLIVLLVFTLSTGQNPDSTHCLILSKHPGTCLHFLTNELYTFEQAANACWSHYHAVPFVPLNDVDHHDLLIKFYFHAKNNKAYDGNIGLGILVGEQNNYYREHLNKYVGENTTANLHMWNQLIYRHEISETHTSMNTYDVPYPPSVRKKTRPGYLRVNGKTGKIEIVEFSEKSYFACHSPRYPKFKCKKGWYTDYVSRTCLKIHSFGKSTIRPVATSYCKQNGGNLASIHNQREYDIFYSFIKKPNLTPAEQEEQTAGNEYWFGLRHQNNVPGLGRSEDPGFDERYKKIAYFVDGSSYTGFHHFHAIEPNHREGQETFNGQTLTNNGWYRNWKSDATYDFINGVLCQCVVDISGSNL